MPLVRISHAQGAGPDLGSRLSMGVHRAMVDTFNVPEEDFFQIVTEHVSGTGLLAPKSFLGIEHSGNIVMVQITCAEGRSVDQKKALYRAIVDNLAGETGISSQDVIINLVETKRENWSFGNGLAPFV